MHRPVPILLLLFACVGFGTACVSVPPAPTDAGLYGFPDELDMHYPYLWLTDTGRFAFLDDVEKPDTPEECENAGVFTRDGDRLVLQYESAYCCQFTEEKESLEILGRSDAGITVRFRGDEVLLERISPQGGS